MSIKLIGAKSGTQLDTNSSKAVYTAEGVAALPQIGGWYTVAGGPAGIVAAALGANVALMTMRFAPYSARRAYIDKMRLHLSVATIGVTAGVAGQLGIQRFVLVTPTGGVARVPNRLDEYAGSGSDMFDIRDAAAALTVTGVAFKDYVAIQDVPLMTGTDELGWEWIFEPPYPVVLQPGEGLALRTVVAMAAVQTWVFSYTWNWHEELPR